MTERQEGTSESAPPAWEREALARLATAALTEQRRARRWGILFKSLILLYLFIVLFAVLGSGPLLRVNETTSGPHTALVDINGTIVQGGEADPVPSRVELRPSPALRVLRGADLRCREGDGVAATEIDRAARVPGRGYASGNPAHQ